MNLRIVANTPADLTMLELFERQAGHAPHAEALLWKDRSWSYRELAERADRIACMLLDRGVGQGGIVGIFMRRSMDLVAAILGAWKAGAAYVPIDPEYPARRIAYMLEDSGVRCLLTDARTFETVRFEGQSIDASAYVGSDGIPPKRNPLPGNALAYLIYTSGSSGTPKGVMIEHGALRHFLCGITQAVPFSPGETIVAIASFSFDIFVLETLVALCCGMRVVMAGEDDLLNPRRLAALLGKHRPEMLQLTPSRLHWLLGDKRCASALESLRKVIVGGEPISPGLVRLLRQYSDALLYNAYGPTEATVWCSVKRMDDESDTGIGRPLRNTEMIVCDAGHRPLPPGKIGELYVAGEGLARGYWRQPGLTRDKFVFRRGRNGGWERWYRTGDLAIRRADGEFELLGRSDRQVKIRGKRVELNEIEAALAKHPNITEAAAVLCNREGAAPVLAVFYVADRDPGMAELRAFLAGTLPAYMVPSSFRRIERMPLTNNGKRDYGALIP